ncbi:MAG TPA: DUF420 domain-containing protein [Pseudogracilibacillus sp.]|nr:DUF420 domain-containing protein [Pseudogracilibacillus sp.]
MKYETSNSQKSYTGIIWGVSIVAVLIILVINYIPLQTRDDIFGIDIHTLPLFNAIFNGTSLLLLLCAFAMIKKGNIKAHRNFIFAAFTVTFFFLVTYLTYHTLAPSTSFGGDGALKYTYYIVLITHILTAPILLPLALFTVARGLTMQKEKHRKMARWTMPIWLYVNVTGVLVYILISPYY